jgi:glycosyltransferase involved in cell wall biosynthesis
MISGIFDDDGVEIRSIKMNDTIPWRGLQFWLGLPRAIRMAEQESKFDIIHVNGTSYWFTRKLSRSPHVSTIHHLARDARIGNNPSITRRVMDISGENGFVVPIIEERAIRCSDHLVAVSEYTRRRIVERYSIGPERIDVIQNGVEENDRFEVRSSICSRLGIPDKPIVLFVGRYDDPRKDIDALLDAFRIVVGRIGSTLVIVGKGNKDVLMKKADRRGVSDKILVAGYISDEGVRDLYSACDIYVSSSRLEGFGLTILEAMAAGKPVVATDVGAIAEILEDGKNGFLVHPGDSEEIARRIVQLLTDKTLRETISANNLRRVQDSFSWSRVAELTVRVYEKCLRERSSPSARMSKESLNLDPPPGNSWAL